jgi:hypothetical protein
MSTKKTGKKLSKVICRLRDAYGQYYSLKKLNKDNPLIFEMQPVFSRYFLIR